MTIAVTGPLACGKSTFVRILGELGAETVSADALVHDLLLGDEKTIRRIAGRFGDGVRGEEGGIDRRALAGVVFGDPEALKDLEDILHPLVREETDRRVSASDAEVFVAEIPLLFEGERSGQFDLTVAVTAPEERRRAWAAERGMGEDQRRAIEARQLPQEEKARRADVVVENDGDLDKLRGQAEGLFERFRGGNGRREGEEG
ncbi:dephospho-CoA kinase [Rubrobacter marinus]|uniref:Dephospho-CoA kinase n=1 Tax=Rubrobacter marinus TaxID=2653852 RepID=A0A6G8PVJ7_9ACTN|nr:dephospho-CoA kinase [Rubrobacter marinus]QIN78214.1 dephospho-CoA kinase [Rubrobacter marinus]